MRGEIVPFYQPIVNLQTGAVAGFEALARWLHPQRGMVPPDEFLGLTDEMGLMHELGLLMAALTAMGAGANPVYLGPEVPLEDLLQAVSRSGAAALGVSVVSASPAEIAGLLARLRKELPANVHLWIGGAGSARVSLPRGVERLENLVQLEQRVSLLAFEPRKR